MKILSSNGEMPYEEAINLIAEADGFDPREYYTDGKPDISKILARKKGSMVASLTIDKEKKIIKIKLRNDFSGYVYLIASDVGLTKIGHAENVKKRFETLSVASPVKLNMVFSKRVRNRIFVENLLHSRFSDKRKLGEWFLLDTNDIEIAREMIIKNVDVR